MDFLLNGWATWLIIAVVLFIIEMLSGVVAALCFAIGCVGAIIPAACGASVSVQVLVAVIVAILSFILIGPTIKRFYARTRNHQQHYSTNMDALIGRVGNVTAAVTASPEDKGRVQIDGDNWLAFTDPDNAPLMPGDKAQVVSYNSIILKVKPAHKG